MKEERHYLDTLQTIFIEKMMRKIAQGKFSIYGESTLKVLSRIIDSTYYTNSQKEWLMTIREDYLNEFCR
jgi:hypothetical protein